MVDSRRMLRMLVVLMGVLLLGQVRAQDRQAKVTTNDGRVFSGRVVAMNLANLQIQVGEELVTIAAEEIRTCHFDDGKPQVVVVPNAAGASPVPTPATKADNPVAPKPGEAPPRVRLPLPDPVVEGQDEAPIPHDLRRSLLRGRLDGLDQRYPWLVPTEPFQWISIGLLLFACLSLVVHLSASVVGSENNAPGRCMALGGWYLLTALLQVALVPSLQLTTFIMLIGNPAFALFWLRSLFDLSRGAAVIAYAVQLGFVLLGYGLLELITALLGSIGTGQI